MTDMRATERLLEVIEENAGDLYRLGEDFRATYDWIVPIYEAITELRRRGDTLVRADDLRVVLEAAVPDCQAEPEHTAFDRLENALGGKLA